MNRFILAVFCLVIAAILCIVPSYIKVVDRQADAFVVGLGSGGAPTDATYLVDTANGTLSAEVVVTVDGKALVIAADYAAMRTLLDLESGTDFYSKTAADTAFEGELDNEAGLMAALADVSNFVQDNEKFTGQVTVQSFGADDATPDVSNAALGTNNVYQTANANPTTITDFDDGDDHSEFADGDWFILRVDDANTIIKFDDNVNIEGNAAVPFTGSDTQPVYLLFIYEDARWNCVNFTSGFSDPTTFAPSAMNMAGGTFTSAYQIITPQSKTYTGVDESQTMGTDITSAVVLVTAVDDNGDESIDLQDGTVAGQIVTFIVIANVDVTDDAFIVDAETDSTCTGCPDAGIFTLETEGSSVTLYWTGAFWHYCGSTVGE